MTSINLVYEIFWQRSVPLLAQNDKRVKHKKHQASRHCLVEGFQRKRLDFEVLKYTFFHILIYEKVEVIW